MAQAFSIMYGSDKVNAYSAGSRPSGKINPKAIFAMGQLGYDLSTHASKSIEEVSDKEYEYVITMGCGDSCPSLPSRLRQDWALPDPKTLPIDEFRRVRDEIEQRVSELRDQLLRQQ